MTMRFYRLTLIGCALSWFMVGLHVPVLHELTHPGHAIAWPPVVATLLLLASGIATLWMLLRATSPFATDPRSGGVVH